MVIKTYKMLGICAIILCTSFFLKNESIGATNNTDVTVFINPGEVDYNVSGTINLGSISGNIVATTLTGTFSTGSFRAKDLSGVYYTGTRHRKISSSQMIGQNNGAKVPANTYYVIRPNTSATVTFSGTATTGANITSYSGGLDISASQQQPIMTLINNSGYLYWAAITPSLAITIPAGQQIDTYKAVLTVTVPWSS